MYSTGSGGDARAQGSRLPIVNLDLFEAYNATHSYEAGDALLKTLGKSIAGTLKRGTDLGARYGGDEFAIILSGASVAEVDNVSRLLRRQFAADCAKAEVAPAGLSIGIAVAVPRPGDSPSRLVAAAGEALCVAKQRGRGRTEMARGPHELDLGA